MALLLELRTDPRRIFLRHVGQHRKCAEELVEERALAEEVAQRTSPLAPLGREPERRRDVMERMRAIAFLDELAHEGDLLVVGELVMGDAAVLINASSGGQATVTLPCSSAFRDEGERSTAGPLVAVSLGGEGGDRGKRRERCESGKHPIRIAESA